MENEVESSMFLRSGDGWNPFATYGLGELEAAIDDEWLYRSFDVGITFEYAE